MEIDQDVFEKLRKKYRGHGNVARELGIDPRHYYNVRTGKKTSEALANLVKYFVKENIHNQEEPTCDTGA